MTPLATIIRRTGQALFCASALSAGAAVAWATRPTEPTHLATFPPATHEHVLASIAGTAEPSQELEPQPTEAPAPAPEPEPRTGTFAENLGEGMVITGATDHRLILFTFDDGPDTRNTPQLLDTLDEYGVRAGFFLTTHRLDGHGPWQEANRELAREIVRRGHIIGNHTAEHAQLPLLDSADVLSQARRADDVLEELLGSRAWLFRPPGGARSPRVDRVLARRGYTQVLWNIGTGDFQVRDPEQVLRTFTRVLARREREHGERGGIVLLHDTHAWSVAAVPRIVSWIRERNCELLEAGDELYDIVDDPRVFHAARSEDASAEAPRAALPETVMASRQRALRAQATQRCERVASR